MFLLSSRNPDAMRLRGLFVVVVLAAAGLGGCGGQPVYSPGPAVPEQQALPPRASGQSVGQRAAVVAVRQVGVPYRYGGNSASGFDCSGLVQYAYGNAGKRVPRTTADLWRQTRPVHARDLEVGDVLFFDIEGKVGHVGLYLGERRFVHAPATGREVTIEDLDSPFYRQAFIRGGRP